VTILFGIVLKWFVPGGYTDPSRDLTGFIGFMVFPAISVALPKIAMTVRFMKTRVKTELGKNYVRTARAKGNTTDGVMWKHVFKNSLMPVITFIGLIVAEVMAGSIMIEQVFNLPGMGRLLVTSIANRDFNVVQAIVIYIATAVIFVNMIVDIAYKLVDPRNIT
ncbi:MAG: ABC transporter permease, partial [Lachnospiraceae bacterium]|nr:ABC transporter permease [Lachnospiraceae bacterium]